MRIAAATSLRELAQFRLDWPIDSVQVWDQELASVAQTWADQCNFEHDCGQCRRVGKTNKNQAKTTQIDRPHKLDGHGI